MLSEFAETYPSVNALYDEASSVLGFDLWDIVCNGPDEKLNSTDITQPAMLTAGVAVWTIWNENNGEQPAFMAGHSLGEYSALVAAGAIEFADGARLVAARSRRLRARQLAVHLVDGGESLLREDGADSDRARPPRDRHGSLPVRAPSSLRRLVLRLLGDADDDRHAPGVRPRHHRLHPGRHPA